MRTLFQATPNAKLRTQSRRRSYADRQRKRLLFESLEDRNMLTAGLSIDDTIALEGDTAELLVSLSEPSAETVTVDYITNDGTATAGSDYTAATGQLVFQPYQTAQIISVTTLNDVLAERDETFSVTLSNPTNAQLVDATATTTILDNEAAQLSVSDATTTEGGQLVFVVTRLGDASAAASVQYATADNTATAADDYTAASGTLYFAAYQRSKTITVSTTDDTSAEVDETLTVTLSDAIGATIAEGSSNGTILDDEAPGFVISDVSAREGDDLVFTVTRLGDASGTASVLYDGAAGGALLSFAAYERTQIIGIYGLADDDVPELDQTFIVNLRQSWGATIIDDTGIATAYDDEPPAFGISGGGQIEEGETASFVITRYGDGAVEATVDYSTIDGTAVDGSDYTAIGASLTFAPGQRTETIYVSTTEDSSAEVDEDFSVSLSNATVCREGGGGPHSLDHGSGGICCRVAARETSQGSRADAVAEYRSPLVKTFPFSRGKRTRFSLEAAQPAQYTSAGVRLPSD